MSPSPVPPDISNHHYHHHHHHVAMVDRDASSQEASPDASETEAPADLMVVSRARRSNAGNRMSTLLAQAAEEEAEDWGDEWKDAPDEEEFVGGDANEADDYNLQSSSESEDEDEGADDDDDTGEKELRRAERQERNKKRKTAANPFAARLAAARKKVKLDAPAGSQPSQAPRPKKKSERASWIPAPEDGPVRTSMRKQTVANKEHTMAKLKEKDRRRDDTLAMMKAAEARKAKDEPKAMTQAERLAEAARVERVNSKSLHRWEEAEEQRAAERQAKLDALKNRQIDGPFIRYWSGPAIWVDDKIRHTGKDVPTVEELDEKLNKDIDTGLPHDASQPVPTGVGPNSVSAASTVNHHTVTLSQTQHPQIAPPNAPVAQSQTVQQPQPSVLPPQKSHAPSQGTAQEPQAFKTSKPEGHLQNPSTVSHGAQHSNTLVSGPSHGPGAFLSGIEQYASQQPPVAQPGNVSNVNGPANAHQNHQHISIPAPPTNHSTNFFSQPPVSQPEQAPIPPNPFSQPSTHSHSHYSHPHPSWNDPSLSQSMTIDPQSLLQQFQRPPVPPPPPAPPRRKVIRKALRNLLILSKFPNLDSSAALPSTTSRGSRTSSAHLKEKDRAALIQLSSTLFGWSLSDATALVTSMLNAPRTKKEREGAANANKARRELCAVTNQVARYRDPGTGIPYYDRKAYAVLRGVVGGDFVWCGALGCYVGGRVRPSSGGPSSSEAVKPAAGVPKRFADLSAGPPTPKEKEKEKGVVVQKPSESNVAAVADNSKSSYNAGTNPAVPAPPGNRPQERTNGGSGMKLETGQVAASR